METDWTGGGAFKGVERSPSCRARRASNPQRGEDCSPRARTAGSSGLYPVTLQTGVGEVVPLHEPALGVRRNRYPESYLSRRCQTLRVKKEGWGTNLNLRSQPHPTIKALYLGPERAAPSLACRILT